ncbi:glycosyltransferase family 4 protein [Orbaceae bacterium ESL0721]|nr:glycosyltransferase family 4 protein [Orbaceae bacterium ESL0721]
MQLAFCIYNYFPFGGLQRDFLQIAKACQAAGAKIRLYVISWQGEQPDGMDIVFVPRKGFTNHSRNENYAKWVKAHLDKNPVDIVVGFNKMPGLDIYFAGDTCFAAKAAKRGFFYRHTKRCKHYLDFEAAVFKQKTGKNNTPYPTKETEIIVLTKQQIGDFQHFYQTNSNRFHLLPPGIAADRKYDQNSARRRQQFRDANQIKADDFVIVQIGSDFRRKGVDRSLYAIASLPESLRQKVIYLVIGQDNPADYQKIAKTEHIDDRVRFYSGRNDIPDFLFAADLLLHPARQEAAGMVLVEALAAGVPVVVTGNSGYAFHVQEADAGIILSEPYKQSELNSALQQAISDQNQLLTWHKNAIAYGEEHDLYHLADSATATILKCGNHE